MRMAVDVHPPRRNSVEDLPPVLGVQVNAFAADERQRWRRRLRLSIGMPEGGAVAIHETHARNSSKRPRGSRCAALHSASVSRASGLKRGISPITQVFP